MTSYERSRSTSPMIFQRSNMTSPNSDRALVPYQESSLGKPLTLNINSAGGINGINGKGWNVLRTIPNGAASTTTFSSDSSGYLEERSRKPIRHTISQENIYKSEHIKNPTQGTEFKEEYILETTTRITNGRSSSNSIERTNYPLKRARSETRLSSYAPSQKSVTFDEGNQQARNGSIISYGNSINDIFKLYQTRDCLGYVFTAV
uniref:Uncharacterized protein n=1 Tax=Acrobeloides nanus TaxID=290746 RepID=A0A914EK24_9BILA